MADVSFLKSKEITIQYATSKKYFPHTNAARLPWNLGNGGIFKDIPLLTFSQVNV